LSSFDPGGYRELVNALCDHGYSIRGYSDSDPAAKHLILRHDVDYSPEAALAIGDVERSVGARSTFFFLLRSVFYNPLSSTVQRTMRELQSMGHAIGLHHDPTASDNGGTETAIVEEARILALVCGREIEAVSFHRPAPQYLRGPDKLAGLWNAYGKRFMVDMGYCSDSRGEWGHGHPMLQEAVRDGRGLQLLTHPIWWASAEAPPAVRLTAFLHAKSVELDQEMSVNSRVYQSSKTACGSVEK
jgi:hypothetical protein